MRRIWVVGSSPGSGKSYVADRLGRLLDLPVHHMDELFWKPGWTPTPDEEFHQVIRGIAGSDRWILDGSYSRFRRPVFHRAEFVIWLDLPLAVTLPRLVRRTLRRAVTGEPCCNGNRESIRAALLSRDSLLLWALTTHRGRRRDLMEEVAGRDHVRLRSGRAVTRWMKQVEEFLPH